MTALTREDLIHMHNVLPKHGRGRRVLQHITRKLTNEELHQYVLERQLAKALEDSLNDPDFQATLGMAH